jgi:hypothetical protein
VYNLLDQLFFFYALDGIDIRWNAAYLEQKGRSLGLSWRRDFPNDDGTQQAVILLHPTRTLHLRRQYAARGQTLAEERLGTILHEMLHVFLTKLLAQGASM